jgi:two-component system, OmpR family, response regulator ChvI
MVVDDELDLVRLLKLTLESKGFRVNIFTDANIALEHFRNKVSSLRPHPYDLLVLDIRMPKMDGFELYNEIKKHDSAVKVCFMTALAGLNEYTQYKEQVSPLLGQRHFVQKPVRSEELLQRINSLMSWKG